MRINLPCGRVALVDDADRDLLAGHTWYSNKGANTYYAYADKVCAGVRVRTRMHRLVMAAPDHLEVDHINGNGLDNRRQNLRLATRAQNAANRPIPPGRYRGVTPIKGRPKFVANIRVNFKQIYLGEHSTPEDAARAYDAAALKHFGEFARLNFPEAV